MNVANYAPQSKQTTIIVKASEIRLKLSRRRTRCIERSEIQTRSLEFGRGDLMLLELLVKRAAWDPEALGRLLYAAALLL